MIHDQNAGGGVGDNAGGIEVDDVAVRFGGVEALRSVSLFVAAGSTCGIIGPNGAGKSTLLDVVSGLCRSTSGAIRLGGHDVTTLSPVKRARSGPRRTFQRPQVFGRLTVLDNVLTRCSFVGHAAHDVRSEKGLRERDRPAAIV
jgi:branched-chain amino acid transport system ATP-binding protein